ncbi:MAG: hypothetical protein MJE68_12000 [Proteobacteria bacterium]|nr:hypothetical protein [Pseudomonadota bacterium]
MWVKCGWRGKKERKRVKDEGKEGERVTERESELGNLIVVYTHNSYLLL